MNPSPDDLLSHQIEYYRARAPEYDDWWYRRGRYDRGPEFTRQWRREILELEAALDEFQPTGDVVELAAGTGAWTKLLALYASTLTAIDAAPETITINRTKLAGSRVPVRYIHHDIFSWKPDRRYDVVFFGFWLTHVPLSHFDSFWSLVGNALKRNGRFFFVDSAYPTEQHARSDIDTGLSLRQLEDGREFRIVKQFWHAQELRDRLDQLGWEADIRTTRESFIYGCGSLRGTPQ